MKVNKIAGNYTQKIVVNEHQPNYVYRVMGDGPVKIKDSVVYNGKGEANSDTGRFLESCIVGPVRGAQYGGGISGEIDKTLSMVRGGGGSGYNTAVGGDVGFRTEALVRGHEEKMNDKVGVKYSSALKKSGEKKGEKEKDKGKSKKGEKEKNKGKPAPKMNSPGKFAGQMGPAITLTSPGLFQAQSHTNSAHFQSGHAGYQYQTLAQGNMSELDRLEAQARSNPRFVSSNIHTRPGNYAGEISNINYGSSHNHGSQINRLEYQARANPRVVGSSMVNRGKFSLD